VRRATSRCVQRKRKRETGLLSLVFSLTLLHQSFPTDGVLGLAFRGMSKIDDRRLPTLLDAMAKATESPVFAFQLTTTDDDVPSEFHFGGVDLSRVGAQPQIAYFPVLTLPSTFLWHNDH
jgi:hypothetical protein